MPDDVTLLFGLEGVEVASIALDREANPILALVTAAEQARRCPNRGVTSHHPHA
ncbi:hypothetical protein SCATT_p08550 (plasmid) [Streptantibioticus cattleyicolor NRRL 8057 = DSM 46488]|uniref:Uncharacterized protein n=1 Tax=Streptantibioticus cattleyicolor (strain ATCC 35852 / DSM 46488 / JCM 4925 / NBRC 14057 / NRRL 8057) TaxID=1003195 RepID=F8JNI3_STREN